MRIAIRRKEFARKCVLRDIDIRLEPGETCAVIGPTGIGKSSLLQIAAGLDKEFDGTISGAGEPLGYLFQGHRLLPWKTALQNVQLVVPSAPDTAIEWLSKVGLKEAADVYPAHLSLGMARRVALARALCVNPRLLLLDEPFSSLDQETARSMQTLVREEVARLQATLLVVTHSWSDIAALVDRIVTLGGSPATIVSDTPVLRKKAAE